MKLRNKKTGVINYGDLHLDEYESLAELNAEWEDYKESKEYFYIYANQVLKGECDGIIEDKFKEVGNYFETREEAEKAVEKLKAWKRLKDKGFVIEAVVDKFFCLDIFMKGDSFEEIKEDLKIVFGDKDESKE